MRTFIKEKFKTLLIYYRIILISSTIFSILLFMIKPVIDPLLLLALVQPSIGFIFGVFIYHRYFRNTYNFFRNQGFTIKRMIFQAWLLSLTGMILLIFLRCLYV